MGLRSLAAAREILRLRIAGSVATIGLALVGARWGMLGATWGLSAGTWVLALGSWWLLGRGFDRSAVAPAQDPAVVARS